MQALLLAALMALPLYPLNPIEQDTLATFNAHMTAGVSAPNGITSTGAEVSTMVEMLVVHPFVLRGGLDYRFGRLTARRYPDGLLHGSTLSLEGLAYRGTTKLTGFVGLGAVFGKYYVNPTAAASDSLMTNHNIYGVYVEPAFGYRFVAGLRMHSAFSIELAVTSITTDFLYRQSLGENSYRQWREPAKFRDFRLSFGYVLPLLDIHP